MLEIFTLLPVVVGFFRLTPWLIPFLGLAMLFVSRIGKRHYLEFADKNDRVMTYIRMNVLYIAFAGLLYGIGYGIKYGTTLVFG
mgnify:CR=1 FL=1